MLSMLPTDQSGMTSPTIACLCKAAYVSMTGCHGIDLLLPWACFKILASQLRSFALLVASGRLQDAPAFSFDRHPEHSALEYAIKGIKTVAIVSYAHRLGTSLAPVDPGHDTSISLSR